MEMARGRLRSAEEATSGAKLSQTDARLARLSGKQKRHRPNSEGEDRIQE